MPIYIVQVQETYYKHMEGHLFPFMKDGRKSILEFDVAKTVENPMAAILSRIDEINKESRIRFGNDKYWYLQSKFLKILWLNEGEGIDRWGKFYNLTGYEEKGHCFWCHKPTKYRYCSPECKDMYPKHFHWLDARSWCYQRYGVVCSLCGVRIVYKRDPDRPYYVTLDDPEIEIHHIRPLKGSNRNWSVLNHPDNLIPLCQSCHKAVHSHQIDLIEFLQD